MAIYRDGSEVRVERSEKKARTIGFLMLGGTAFLAAYAAPSADRASDWLLIAGILGLGVLLLAGNLRRRNVCVVRPNEIGYSHRKGEMIWFDRADIDSIQIADNLLLQVRCFDRAGKLRQAFVLSNFEKSELREAFEEAGIPVK